MDISRHMDEARKAPWRSKKWVIPGALLAVLVSLPPLVSSGGSSVYRIAEGRTHPGTKLHTFSDLNYQLLHDLRSSPAHDLGVPHLDHLPFGRRVRIGLGLLRGGNDEGLALGHAHHGVGVGPGLAPRLALVVRGKNAKTGHGVGPVEHGRGPELLAVKGEGELDVLVRKVGREGKRQSKMRGKLRRVAGGSQEPHRGPLERAWNAIVPVLPLSLSCLGPGTAYTPSP